MKRIQILLLLVVSFFCHYAFSQNTLQVDYHSSRNGDYGECTLITNEYLSTWESNYQSNTNMLNNVSFYFFKDKKNKMIYYQNNILTKKIAIKDTLNKMSWEITNAKKKVLGFACQEAKTSFRGRNYIAYFTEDLAINDGPWKFGGLPGLILEIKSVDGYLSYEANKITRLQENEFNLPDTETTKFLNWDEYKQMFVKIYNNYINLIKTSEDMDLDSEVNIKVQTTEIVYPKIQTENGYVIKRN